MGEILLTATERVNAETTCGLTLFCNAESSISSNQHISKVIALTPSYKDKVSSAV